MGLNGAVPYWRLSGFYLVYFAALGSILPYWGLYLQSEGFGATEIGLLIALLHLTKVIAPNIWGALASGSSRPVKMIQVASFISAVAFAALFFGEGFWWLAAVMLFFSFFWNATLPQFEAVTLSHLHQDSHRYSLIRIWGSIGFIIVVYGIGKGLESLSIELLPIVIVSFLGAIWLVSLSVPEPPKIEEERQSGRMLSIVFAPGVLAFLMVCFLIQASHGPYYVFYSIYLEQQGYTGGETGLLWALGVVAEVLLFLVMHRVLKRFSLRFILLVGLVLTGLRWLMIALWIESLPVLLFAQLLHAASFGSNHVVAIHLIHLYFGSRHQVKGQALYSSISFGLGGVVGSLFSGYLWDVVGPQTVFLFASLLGFIALLIGWKWVADDSIKS